MHVSTNKLPKDSPEEKLIQPTAPLSLHDLATVLVKHYDLHEGYYDLLVGFQIGFGSIGPDPEHALPGAMVGVQTVGLIASTQLGPNTVDAAAVNPLIKPRKKKRP